MTACKRLPTRCMMNNCTISLSDPKNWIWISGNTSGIRFPPCKSSIRGMPPQWEYFHETDEASDTKFLHFLKNSAYPLSMRYNMVDLNVKYYLERFQALKPRSKEWKALRTLFFDKWHRLLSNNEFNYQMEHINRLSEEFYRLQISLSKNLPIRGDSRLGMAIEKP